ncbi:hypothetical protein ACN28C_19300 [Plantactinospora sp. WMMC1484]|uniref:hypothetical protein n=1 Tax=Plantactinospora sp. WMMC1484 TaxID=3404122 RepID=UPI003BF60DF0
MSYEGAEPFDLSKTFVHLGLGASAVDLPGFKFTPDVLRQYLVRFVKDRDEGRLVGVVPMRKTWTHWEQHVHGDEVVVLLTGRCEVIQELADGRLHTLSLGPGEAMINPRGVWHTTDVHDPGSQLFIAAGRQTIYRPRE